MFCLFLTLFEVCSFVTFEKISASFAQGIRVGATDELGKKAVENVYHTHNLHATILRLMGLDDMELTYYHVGRFKRLTDLGGKTIDEVIA